MLGLPFLDLEVQLLHLFLQLALVLLCILDVALELLFQILAASLEVSEIGLKLLVLFLVVVQFLLQAGAWSQRGGCHCSGWCALLAAHTGPVRMNCAVRVVLWSL